MKTVQLTTEYAFPALINYLTRCAYVKTTEQQDVAKSVTMTIDLKHVANVAECLNEWLLENWLIEWLKGDLRQKVDSSEWGNTEHLVLMSVYQVKSGSSTIGQRSYGEWAEDARVGLQQLLETSELMSVDGFVRFRLRPFVEELRACIFTELKQLLLDKEYEESLEMLRLMLDAHPRGQQEMHVFCTSRRVWLTDPTGMLICDEEVSDAAFHASEEEVDSEDLAISILIARSPRKIVLHDLHPDAAWPSFSETLCRVFERRVKGCGHCSTCHELELSAARSGDESTRHHHLGPQP